MAVHGFLPRPCPMFVQDFDTFSPLFCQGPDYQLGLDKGGSSKAVFTSVVEPELVERGIEKVKGQWGSDNDSNRDRESEIEGEGESESEGEVERDMPLPGSKQVAPRAPWRESRTERMDESN
jgi:hypothetical protein